ncbi:MAG: hypothetical protein Q9M37_01280 [Desulfonauticus sp.]|nr:hypothetical protein [Desulfonauticus sp.]
MKKVILTLCFLFLFCSKVEAGIVVDVKLQTPETQSSLDVKKSAYKEAFLQACLKETEHILGVNLSDDRLSVLRDFLEPEVDNLIYGYREIFFNQSENQIELKLECEINKKLLRKELRKYGVLFTAKNKIVYNLSLQGVSPEEFITLNRLQILTGLEVKPGAKLQLTIIKGENNWRGILIFGDHVLETSASSLQDLWLKLWGQYFDLPEVMDQLTEHFEIITTGWVSADSIHNFDLELSKWDQVVLKKELLDISLATASMKAKWKIWTLNKDEFLNKLKDFLHNQNISYSITIPIAKIKN